MDPFTIIIILVSLAALSLVWPYLCHILVSSVLPLVERFFGHGVKDMIAKLIAFIDKRVGMVRNKVLEAFRYLKENLLGLKTTYSKTSPSTAHAKTEAYVKNDKGGITMSVSEYDVDIGEVPEEVQESWIMNNVRTTVVKDQRNVIAEKLKSELSNSNMQDIAAEIAF